MKKSAPKKTLGISLLLMGLIIAGVVFFTSTDLGQRLAIMGIDMIGYTQNLADPYYRYIRIPEGWRKEQIADAYSQVLAWNDTQKQAFLSAYQTDKAPSADGYYFPTTYLVPADASGKDVSKIMINQFNQKVGPVISSTSTVGSAANKNLRKKVNLDTAIKIASIIQREAAGKSDMRLISGIIWNRLFKGMALDIDATLQYAAGNEQDGWWPPVSADDKSIDSPYNTYKNKGLPPTPIANPGLAAIEAAFNPLTTDCLFYLHDNNRNIHCSADYKGQQQNVVTYLK
ncbi:MAG: endolytic transglycosylase MltG [Candidatus Pacebacteria bacterium]|nr:endolytic transglycosylase MltG [Candidatus Paceibacterota bacterium]